MKSHHPVLLSFVVAVWSALLLLQGAQAFVAPSLRNIRHNNNWSKIYSSSESSSEFSETETQEMRDLILSLSLEPTDHDRRTRVKDVFHEALAGPNGTPKRFTELFDMVLVEVGDKVQSDAKKKFFEDQAAAQVEEESSSSPTDSTSNASDEDEDYVPPKRTKSPEEFQLWALVDMMVQTKTIVKKENGELGNKGTFT
jgi:hypothetical protein